MIESDAPAAASGVGPRTPAKPPPPRASAPKKGQLIKRKYRLERLIARGGMGAVWAGMDTSLDRPVAIKFMDPEIAASAALRARFNQEAKAAAQLRTPYVVQIHEHGVHAGLPFIVMELLEGEDLHARLKRERRLPLRTAARILTQTAKALKKAHGRGIVHRDLKPQNIFIAHQDDEEVVKILDFGIAKSTGRDAPGESTKTGVVLGSPHYMSPEQARGLKTIDHRADLWSLGVIVYRMVTGRLAFTGEATGDIIVRICTELIRRPSETNPSLPPAIDLFFERALSRAPDDRYQSAMEMAQAFADIAEASHDVALFTPPPDSDPGPADADVTTPYSDLGSNPDALDELLLGTSDSASGVGLASGPITPLPSSQPSGVQGAQPAPPPQADAEPRTLAAAGAEPTPLPRIGAAPPPPPTAGAEPTPLPVAGAEPMPLLSSGGESWPSLVEPSLDELADEMPDRHRRKRAWIWGGGAALLGGLLAFVVIGSGETEGESATAPEPDGASQAAQDPAPDTPPTEPSAGSEAEESASAEASAEAASSTSSPEASATAETAKRPARPRPPRPRPPRPASTPTKSKRNWGY